VEPHMGLKIRSQPYLQMLDIGGHKHSSLLRHGINFSGIKRFTLQNVEKLYATKFTNVHNKREYLSLTSLFSLVYYLLIKPEPTRVKYPKGVSL